jgi:hypothetical protein
VTEWPARAQTMGRSTGFYPQRQAGRSIGTKHAMARAIAQKTTPSSYKNIDRSGKYAERPAAGYHSRRPPSWADDSRLEGRFRYVAI